MSSGWWAPLTWLPASHVFFPWGNGVSTWPPRVGAGVGGLLLPKWDGDLASSFFPKHLEQDAPKQLEQVPERLPMSVDWEGRKEVKGDGGQGGVGGSAYSSAM